MDSYFVLYEMKEKDTKEIFKNSSVYVSDESIPSKVFSDIKKDLEKENEDYFICITDFHKI